MPIDKNFIHSRKVNTDAAFVVKKFLKFSIIMLPFELLALLQIPICQLSF